MKIFKIKDKRFCPKFKVGEEVARCYVQRMPFLGVMYFSLETGIQQILWNDMEQLC